MPFCAKCGTEVPENINFCQKCGSAVATTAKTESTARPHKPKQPSQGHGTEREKKISNFTLLMGNRFSPGYLSILDELDDKKLAFVLVQNYRSPVIMLIISIIFGAIGVDRFMLGQTGSGVLKLLIWIGGYILVIVTGSAYLFIVCWLWYIIDWFLIMKATRTANSLKLKKACYFS